MKFSKPDTGYWERKFIAYMHDPFDKVFEIPGHGERSARLIEKYGLQRPNEHFWKKADSVAAGFERGQVPSYSPDPDKNGAVDFLKNPVITHPTSEAAQIEILMPGAGTKSLDDINERLLEFIEKQIGMKPGQGGYSDRFKGREDEFAVARFLYTHLVLRFDLAEGNVGGLGGFWHRIPADSRFPDHSIWQHNSLCSAIYSSIELAGDVEGVGIMAFSITPVQEFIAKARKLRDYWTGSVLLSWLAFEGLRWVMENLGADHMLYPSLVDQPLVNEYLEKKWKTTAKSFLNESRDIASLPNKFVFLVPMEMNRSIAAEIKNHISRAWKQLYEKACVFCTSQLTDDLPDTEKGFIKEIFERQNSDFWVFNWAACRLVVGQDQGEIENLLPETAYRKQFDLIKKFNKIIEDNQGYDNSGRGVLYSVSHSLVQTALAASKVRKKITRFPETGEKCHLCGEFEVLHHRKYAEGRPADQYKENINFFWNNMKLKLDGDKKNNLGYNLNENEKLCSICFTKRMAYKVIEEDKDHILNTVFKDKKSFPSTTDLALINYFEREGIPEHDRKIKSQLIHEQSDEKTENRDRYFTILLMDGDNMGKLVNGETLASTWESVMHPEIVERLKNPGFEKKYRSNWLEIFEKHRERLVTPSIHAAISESLGDFSLYGVGDIVRKHRGTLIYAGGDDVCAFLPVETSLRAAHEIQRYYTSSYKLMKRNEPPVDMAAPWEPVPGKLSINLGKGPGISISGAILICHHKENLSHMITRAHELLDERAKKVQGKAACAIELRKRSGGSRYFVEKWSQEKTWDSFFKIGEAIKSDGIAQISSSLVYRLQQLIYGVNAILKEENNREMIIKFISKQLERSSVGDDSKRTFFAERMTDIVLRPNRDGNLEYRPDGLIVAAFMATGGGN